MTIRKWDQLPYQSVNHYLKTAYGVKVYKASVNGGFTCPTRDGTKGIGGCIFCSGEGAGECAGSREDSITTQMELEIQRLIHSHHAEKFIAYFQAFTNTYAPVEELRRKYQEALQDPRVVILDVGTRPDCLEEPVIALLQEIAKTHEVWVELGLQTIHEDTARRIHRGYDLSCYDDAMARLSAAGIKAVVHLIFGLPGETKAMMLDSVRYVAASGAWGVKFHLMHVLRDTVLAEQYAAEQFSLLTEEAYLEVVVDAIRWLPPDMVIHRLTAEAPRDILIAPDWCIYKRQVLNHLHKKLKSLQAYQGEFYCQT